MPFALILAGILAVVVAVRDKGTDARALLLSEFTGQNNFIMWGAGIGAAGAVGYVPAFKGLSRAFLLLIFVGIFLAHTGFFEQLRLQLFNRAARRAEISPGNVDPINLGAVNPGGQAAGQVAAPAIVSPGAGSFPAGVGSSLPWTAGLAPATGAQAPCPPGTTATQVSGWLPGVTRCVPT